MASAGSCAPDASGTRVGAMSADPVTRSARAVSSGAAPPARRWCGTPCGTCSRSRRRPAGLRGRHRRRHRRIRGPGRRARPPGHWWSTPARTPWPPWRVGPTRTVSSRGQPATRATSAPCSTWCRPASADVVLCHGVLEMVEDPAAALAAIARGARPGGTLCLLVTQRHAAVITRAMAGHFAAGPGAARRDRGAGAAPAPGTAGSPPTRSPRLLDEAGFDVRAVHARPGVRRPGAQRAGRPRARAAAALLELERAVADRPEYLAARHPAPHPRHPPLTSGWRPARRCPVTGPGARGVCGAARSCTSTWTRSTPP